MNCYTKSFIVNFLCLIMSVCGFSQIGINTTTPHSSSSLDVNSTTTGILVPRMSENQKNDIVNPTKGLLIFQNNEEEGFWYFNGSAWIPLDSKGEFISENSIIHSVTNTKVDDFVIGSTSLNNITGSDDDNRLFFDKGKGAFRSGYNNTTSWDNTNLGSNSVAIGSNNLASGTNSISLGRETIANASYSVSIGRNNTSSGQSAVAFGYLNEAIGDYSTTIGRGNIASGLYSFVGGIDSDATGLQSFAYGHKSLASGENSFSLGRLSTASGLNSVSLGFSNTATNSGSISIGNNNDSTGDFASTLGNNLNAPSFSEVALGLYNTEYTPNSTIETNGNDRIFSIGNGFRTGGVTTKNNAFTILKNGSVGIGTDTPKEALEIHGDDNFSGDADLDMHSYNTNITSFHIRSASGTQQNPAAVYFKSNANFYNMEAQGYDGSSYITASSIRMGTTINNATGLGDMPGRIDFHTSTDGTADNKLRVRIDDNGNVGIGTNSAAITEKLVVEGKIKATSINFSGLPTFNTEAEATSGGLATGDLYQTSAGVLMIKQ